MQIHSKDVARESTESLALNVATKKRSDGEELVAKHVNRFAMKQSIP